MDRSIQITFPHIKSLRDIKDCQFTENINHVESDATKYMCPVTRMELNGLHPFVIIWSTGKVLSAKALKEIPMEELQSEYGPFLDGDIIRLFPSGEELEAAKLRVDAKLHNRKKESKKRPITEKDVPSKKMSRAGQIASAAVKTVSEQSAGSEVFKNLFHTGNETDKHDRDLFMSVAGIRYTLR